MNMNKINSKEEQKHGTPEFPFQAFSQEDISGQYFVPYHWHDEVEVLYVTEGSLLMRTEKTTATLKAGGVYFINPGTVHALFGTGQHSHHFALVFSLELLCFARYDRCQTQFLDPIRTGMLRFPTGESLKPDIRDAIGKQILFAEELYRKQDTGIPAPLSIKIALLRILELLFLEKAFILSEGDPYEQTSGNSSLRPVFQYIQEHYREKITLDQLSGCMHMNKNYFCKYFREKAGKTPFAYLNEYRINRAAAELLESDALVTDIAMNTGFDNMSYFIRQFKRCKGCSPGAYRRMEKPGAVPIF